MVPGAVIWRSLGASHKLSRRWYVGYVAALAAVSVVSLFIGLVLGQVNLANTSMLYLLAVLATAVAFGRGPAVFASLTAFLIFDWFFVEPLHQFTVSDPDEWVSLVFFLLTATVTGQLAAGQRQRAREARQREREAVVLYDVVRLMSEAEFETALGAVAERLRARAECGRRWPSSSARPNGEPVRVVSGDPASVRLLQTGSGVRRRACSRAARSRCAAATPHPVAGCASCRPPVRAIDRQRLATRTCTWCRSESATDDSARCSWSTVGALRRPPTIASCPPPPRRSAWPSNAIG